MIEDIIRSILGMPPGASRINKDLASIRAITFPMVEQIIPWESERELELMSLKIQYQSKKSGMDKILVGNIQSIYFEPMVAFAYKDYVKGSREALLYCRTSKKELVYILKKHETEIYLNGRQVAILDLKNMLHGIRSRSVIGGIRPYSPDLLSVIIQNKEAGHVFNVARPHSDIQRAFYMIADLSEEEENIFLALGLYELLIKSLANKKKK